MSLRLTVSHVYKSYAGKAVLEDCSHAFESKGIYVLMGPNGCGKSTFLRICSLLESPDRGEVVYHGENGVVPASTALRRRIALVLPKIGVFNTTVFKNVAYGLKIRGIGGKEIRERVEGYLDSFGLLHKRNQNALTLSSGETQRMGIARAMTTNPDILFLDEPTASVDQENTEIIEEIILEMKRKGRPTVILTTHDAGQAERLGDRLLVMKDGKIFPG